MHRKQFDCYEVHVVFTRELEKLQLVDCDLAVEQLTVFAEA